MKLAVFLHHDLSLYSVVNAMCVCVFAETACFVLFPAAAAFGFQAEDDSRRGEVSLSQE